MRLPVVIESRKAHDAHREHALKRLDHLESELRLRDDLLVEIGRNATAMRVLDTAYAPGHGSIGAAIRTLVLVEVPLFIDPHGEAPPLGAELPNDAA